MLRNLALSTLALLLLTASAWAEQEYVVQPGDTLDALAQRKYGHRNYGKLIELHNGLTSQKLKVGSALRLPDLAELLKSETLGQQLPDVVEALLEAKTAFESVQKPLWDWLKARGPVAPELRQPLLKAAEAVDRAVARLSEVKAPIVAVPKSTVRQFKDLASTLRNIAEGKVDPMGYDLDMVHQRLGLGLGYAVLWARDGFR